jgi:hypothetical protein
MLIPSHVTPSKIWDQRQLTVGTRGRAIQNKISMTKMSTQSYVESCGTKIYTRKLRRINF